MRKPKIIFSAITAVLLISACGQGAENKVEEDSQSFGDLVERGERLELPMYEDPLFFSNLTNSAGEGAVDEDDASKGDETTKKSNSAEDHDLNDENQDSPTDNNEDTNEDGDTNAPHKNDSENTEKSETEERSDDVGDGTINYRVMSFEDAQNDPDISDYLSRLTQDTQISGWNTMEYRGGTALIVSAGERRTGGYSLEIRGAKEENGAIRVNIVERAPAPDAMVTMALTNPYIVIEFPEVTPEKNWKVMDVTKGEQFPYWKDSPSVLN